MTKSHLGLLGSVLAAGALAIAGCGGGGGGGGTGGKADAGGTGGKGTGGGTGTGTGGRVDGGAGGMTTVTDAGAGGRTDGGAGGSSDARIDTGPADTGPCVTTYANGTVQFAFNNGANLGWAGSTDGDVSATTASVGGSLTEGSKCPGALSLFVAFGSHVGQKVTVLYNHNSPPLDWSGFAKAHFWLKAVASDYSGINGFQPYVQSATNYSNYKSTYVNASTLSDGVWHEAVVDITASDLPNVVQLGVQIQFKDAPDAGANPAGTVTLYVDDIWLENAPPPDAAPDMSVDTGVDAPAATDTGADTGAAADAGSDAATD